MLIQALSDYYDTLAEAGKVLPQGYSNVKIHQCICLTPEGQIDAIIDLQISEQIPTAKGKIKERLVPRNELMPQRTEKSAIDANIIEHRPLYLFGLNYDKDQGTFSTEDKTGKAQKSHQAFVKANLAFLEGLDSPVVNAFRAFIENWHPEEECSNSHLLALGKAYGNYGYAFCLSGFPHLLLHNDAAVRDKWSKQYASDKAATQGAVVGQCAVSGQREPVARIHGKIKGVSGGLATGAVLIGFNNPSENSYCNEQAYNSNISETVMKKYVEALNYLLNGDAKHKAQKTILDELTVAYWVMSPRQVYNDLAELLMFGESQSFPGEQAEQVLAALLRDAKKGNIVMDRLCFSQGIDPQVDFYLLGLKPNSSRLSVKFLYRRKFGEFLYNIASHQLDMQIVGLTKPVQLWQIKKTLLSPKSTNDKVNPALMVKIMEAMLYGTRYPSFLLATLVRRVKTDIDLEVDPIRAGVIKACINRNARLSGKKEELGMGLDLENNNPAYLCGRLFAVLESLQWRASETQLNRTIKDAYFASSVANPALIFPKLIMLAHNHLKKLKKPIYFERLIGGIIDCLQGCFPGTLSLEEQGEFIVGYYQQRQTFFNHNDDKQLDDKQLKEEQDNGVK